MISLAHMKFRRAKQEQGVVTASLLCFIRWVTGSACCLWRRTGDYADDPRNGDFGIPDPGWLIVLGIGYLFKEKTAKAVKRINLSTPSPVQGEGNNLYTTPRKSSVAQLPPRPRTRFSSH